MKLKAKTNVEIGSWQIEVDFPFDETSTSIQCPSEKTAKLLGDALAACGYHAKVYSRNLIHTPMIDNGIWEEFYCNQEGISISK